MPQSIRTLFQGTAIDQLGLPAFTGASFTVVADYPVKGSGDATGVRNLWLIWLTSADDANTVTQYRYTSGVGWELVVEHVDETPTEVTGIIKSEMPKIARYLSQTEESLQNLDDFIQAQL